MDGQMSAPFTGALCKANLAAGTTTTLTTVSSTSGNLVYAIRGKAYSHADWTNQATPTTDYATGKAFIPVLASQGSVFMVGLDHSGNMKVIQGTVASLDGIAGSGLFTIQAPEFGALGAAGSGSTGNDFCPIGYIVIQAGTTANNTTGWIFGTSNMSAVTGITYTFVDLVGMTDRPQVS